MIHGRAGNTPGETVMDEGATREQKKQVRSKEQQRQRETRSVRKKPLYPDNI